jgi:hypothetical protein
VRLNVCAVVQLTHWRLQNDATYGFFLGPSKKAETGSASTDLERLLEDIMMVEGKPLGKLDGLSVDPLDWQNQAYLAN